MASPTLILRQSAVTAESRAVGLAAMLLDCRIKSTDIPGLSQFSAELQAGAMAVGSVEFMREAMRVAGINEPDNMTYPAPLQHLLRRRVDRRQAGSILGRHFIKPVTTKAFTGFVFDTMRPREAYSEHDIEQYDAFMALPRDAEVWVSEPVEFICEWRYYVQEGRVLSAARYDPEGADDAPCPDPKVLGEAVHTFTSQHEAPTAFALDIGVLQSGETALVEVNDAWALGLYGRALEPRSYLQLLASRWEQLRSQSPALTAARPSLRP